MKIKEFLKTHVLTLEPEALALRRAMSTAIAMFIAVIVDRYCSLLQQFWVGFTVVLILQMTIRVTFRQEALRFFVILCSVLFCSLMYLNIQQDVIRDVIVVAIFVLGCFLHDNFPGSQSGFSPPLMVAFIALMMLIPSSTTGHVIFARLHDVMLGGIVALISSMLIFPGREDIYFRAELIPVLREYNAYLQAIFDLLYRTVNANEIAEEKKIAIEKSMHERRAFFPDWVYEVGFNPSLREGHRHFLLRIEQVGKILFAMHHAARYEIETSLLDKVQAPIARCISDCQSLISNFIAIMQEGKTRSVDFTLQEDMMDLEEAFRLALPLPLELLDMSPDYLHLAGFVYDLSDLQKMLMTLAESLRAYISLPPS